MRAVVVAITGRVQGVGYRWWMVRTARALGLTGWVQNQANGGVLAHAEGGDVAVATLIAQCEHGPAAARVTGVNASVADVQGFTDFEQR